MLTSQNAIDLAREGLYRFFAVALGDPDSHGGQLLHDPDCLRVACEAADLIRAEAEGQNLRLGFGELSASHLNLQPLGDLMGNLPDEYVRVFGLLGPRECPPYETEFFQNEEAFFRAQQLADIAGFYRAFGLEPLHDQPQRADYLPLELEFMAFVLLKKRQAETPEQVQVCAEAEEAFFRDHLAWWLPSYTLGMRHKAGDGFYSRVVEALAAFLPCERQRFGIAPPSVPLPLARPEAVEESMSCANCS